MADPREIRRPGNDIYSADFAKYLPESLNRDPKIKAFAEAVTAELLGVSAHIEDVLIYSRIEELSEELVDILAYDMHVDWYDYAYSLPVKRDILKSSVKVHKKMGTKYAVETALQAVHPKSKIEEWFEYGGEPYRFKALVDVSKTGMDERTGREIEEKMKFYKNLRSHCDGIFFKLSANTTCVTVAAYMLCGGILKVKPLLANEISANSVLGTLSVISKTSNLKIKARKPELKSGAEKSALTYQKIKYSMQIRKEN